MGGAGSAINAAVNGATGDEIFEAFADGALSGAVTGAASGALAASGVGLVGQIVGNTIISGLEYCVTSAITGEFDGVDFAISLGSGALAGYVGGEGAMSFGKAMFSTIAKTQFLRSGTKALGSLVGPIMRGGIATLKGSLIKNLIP